jgi:hypothetical protein
VKEKMSEEQLETFSETIVASFLKKYGLMKIEDENIEIKELKQDIEKGRLTVMRT